MTSSSPSVAEGRPAESHNGSSTITHNSKRRTSLRIRPSSPPAHGCQTEDTSSVSSSRNSPIVAPPPKKRRLELNALRFDSPGAAFDLEIDLEGGRPSRRAASHSSASKLCGDTSPLVRPGTTTLGGGISAPSPPPSPHGIDSTLPTTSSSRFRMSSLSPPRGFASKSPGQSSDSTSMNLNSSSSSAVEETNSRRQRRPSQKLKESSLEEARWIGPTSPIRSSTKQFPIQPQPRRGRPPGKLLKDAPSPQTRQSSSKRSNKDADLVRQRRIAKIQKELDDVHSDHDGLIRELFHLTKFVTYVGYDPEAVRDDRSHVFEHFRYQHGFNLDVQLAAGPSSRVTRRNVRQRMDDLSLRQVSTSSTQSDVGKAPTCSSSVAKASSSTARLGQNASSSISSQSHDCPLKGKTARLGISVRTAQNDESSVNGLSQTHGKSAGTGTPATSTAPSTSTKLTHRLFKNFRRPGDFVELTADLEERQIRELWLRLQPRKLPRVAPVLAATHPTQVPAPSSSQGSLRTFLDSFRFIGEETDGISDAEAGILEQRNVDRYNQIDAAREEGRMTGGPYSAASLRPPLDAVALRPKQVHDLLLSGVSARATSLKTEARHRRNIARKVSRMVQSYWSAKSGDGEKSRKANERHIKSLAKWTAREVNKQWKLAVSVVRSTKLTAEKLERERRGREQLGRILEQSTKYLGARREDLKRGKLEGGEEEGDEEEADESITDGSSGIQSQSEATSASSPASVSSLESDVYSVEDDGSASDASIGRNNTSSEESPEEDTNHLMKIERLNGPDGPPLRSDDQHVFLKNLRQSSSNSDDPSTRKTAHLQQLLLIDRHDAGKETTPSDQLASPNNRIVQRNMRNSPPGTRFSPAQPLRSNGAAHKLITEVDTAAASEPGTATAKSDLAPRMTNGVTDQDSTSLTFEASGGGTSEENEDIVLDEELSEDDSVDDSSGEDEGLMVDADLPIEQLMKRYGYGTHAGRWKAEADGRNRTESDLHSNSTSPVIEKMQHRVEQTESGTPNFSPEAGSLPRSSPSRPSRPKTQTSSVHSGSWTSDLQARYLHPPFLLRGSLRPYQQTGFEWLASLYANKANGILADEMGLGKTIQTITLLAHLACDKGVWGPHLVIAPTSVMLNWEVEFKKFLPAFKVLSYYGSQKERKEKRIGWNTEHQFNVCITSYQLVLADQHIFRRKPWVYMVLDEAHHIKNFRSQRWQTLLGFNSERRLLLTGTPLQNNLMDLWSLMYFLMPNGLNDVAGAGAFANIKDFQEWFSNPLDRAVDSGDSMDEETRKMVGKLHTILRPFLLRRLKSEVEKELPQKFEHVIYCRLSKRQRFLYNDFMSRAKTRESLASGNYLSIINCLMQLRKVCNHPDLFEVRPITTAFAMERSVVAEFEIKDLLIRRKLMSGEGHDGQIASTVKGLISFDIAGREHLSPIVTRLTRRLDASDKLPFAKSVIPAKPSFDLWTIEGYRRTLEQRRQVREVEDWKHRAYVNRLKTQQHPVYGATLLRKLQQLGQSGLCPLEVADGHRRSFWSRCDNVARLVLSTAARAQSVSDVVDRFAMIPPRVLARDLPRYALPGLCYDTLPSQTFTPQFTSTSHKAATKLQIAFPDASLLQYDCGKLQELDLLMRRLKAGGHRILIFTQMTKVLDILEAFLNLHGYRYLRLDGSTRIDRRQALTEKFNRDARIDAFILSTRSGGLGINLTGADTVLFYDLDWNSAIEAQCMDRAHRIGQTRDVHIYRFVSKATIEENMLRKADMKRRLDSVVIQGGDFTTEHLKRGDWRDMLDDGGATLAGVKVGDATEGGNEEGVVANGSHAAVLPEDRLLAEAEDEEDRLAARNARQEMVLEDDTFTDFVREDDPGVETATAGPEAAESATRHGEAAEKEDVAVADGEDDKEHEDGTVDDYMLRFVEKDWDFFGHGGFKV